MKYFTIMMDLDQRKRKNCKAAHGMMDLPTLCKVIPDLATSAPLASLYDEPAVKHIVICIFRNKLGEERRRIGALPEVPINNEQVRTIVEQMASSLNINLDRVLFEEPRIKE